MSPIEPTIDSSTLEQAVRSVLPMPDGRPVPCFFGRRFLSYRELVATGLVDNDMTLRRWIAEGLFPPPLKFGRKVRRWDVLELQAMIERLAGERVRHGGDLEG